MLSNIRTLLLLNVVERGIGLICLDGAVRTPWRPRSHTQTATVSKVYSSRSNQKERPDPKKTETQT